MSHLKNPLARLDRQELHWLTGILKDACRERLEKNLVSQAFEERLYQRGPVQGRLDPRPFLKIWEPRYRKFLEVAGDLHAQMERGASDQQLEEFIRGVVQKKEARHHIGEPDFVPASRTMVHIGG